MGASVLLNERPPTGTRQPGADGRLHVLQVIGNAIVGGMETWVIRLIERLPRERFRFSAVCPFESAVTERLRALEVDVLILPMPEDPPWSSLQLLSALVSAHGVDLLHAHLPKAHLLAGLVGRLSGKPVLCTVHGRQLSLLDLEVHRLVGSHLSTVCRASYIHALGLGVGAELLSCEPNGVDTRSFCPRAREGAGLRGALQLEADTPLLGFVGRLSPEKGPEVFVRALAALQDRHPHARGVLVGEGPLEASLRELACQLGLEQRLHFLGVRDDTAWLLGEFDLLVSSSYSEAMPLALMEAMASGLPVVATQVGGVPDLVQPGVTGWLVSAGDFNELAVRCGNLLADAALRKAMGLRAREHAVQRLELGDSVERVSQLMLRLGRPRSEPVGRRQPALASVRAERPAVR